MYRWRPVLTVFIGAAVLGAGAGLAQAPAAPTNPAVGPAPALTPYQQEANANAAAAQNTSATGNSSAEAGALQALAQPGVPASQCPGAVAAMAAAGMGSPSPTDRFYPDCSAADTLIATWKAGRR